MLLVPFFLVVILCLLLTDSTFFFFHLSCSAVVLVQVAVTLYCGGMFFITCSAGFTIEPIAICICFV